MPIVDDPYDFGRIAATNAISDVYAMGARPFMALALLGMPLGKVPAEAVQRIVAGGQSRVRGRRHSDRGRPFDRFAGADLRPGRAGPGPSRARSSATTARGPGDVLILGKALGVGIMSAALKKGELRDKAYAADGRIARRSSTRPGIKLARDGRRARADRRHGLRAARASAGNLPRLEARGASFDFDAVPVLSAARHLAEAGYVDRRLGPQLGELRGRTSTLPAGAPGWQRKLLTDPQTSGGLLVACDAGDGAGGAGGLQAGRLQARARDRDARSRRAGHRRR